MATRVLSSGVEEGWLLVRPPRAGALFAEAVPSFTWLVPLVVGSAVRDKGEPGGLQSSVFVTCGASTVLDFVDRRVILTR